MLYLDYSLLIVPSLFMLMSSVASVEEELLDGAWALNTLTSKKVLHLLLFQKYWALMSSLALSSMLAVLRLSASPFRG